METTRIKHEILDGFFLYPLKLTCIGKKIHSNFMQHFQLITILSISSFKRFKCFAIMGKLCRKMGK